MEIFVRFLIEAAGLFGLIFFMVRIMGGQVFRGLGEFFLFLSIIIGLDGAWELEWKNPRSNFFTENYVYCVECVRITILVCIGIGLTFMVIDFFTQPREQMEEE